MLAEQNPVFRGAAAVCLRVAPSVEQVAFGGVGQVAWRAVVDDPQFAEVTGADDDLVQRLVVRNGIRVQPVLVRAPAA